MGPALELLEPQLSGLLATAGIPRNGDSPVAAWLDSRVEALTEEAHQSGGLREIDIQTVYQKALAEITGAELGWEWVERICAAHQRAWMAAVVPIPEAVEALRRLRDRGILVGLCSNAPYPPSLMREQLLQLGLADHFDAVVFSSEVGWRKPSPVPFQELLGQLGTRAQDSWFIGDEVVADMEGAKAVGMTPLLAPGIEAPSYQGARLASWGALLSR